MLGNVGKCWEILENTGKYWEMQGNIAASGAAEIAQNMTHVAQAAHSTAEGASNTQVAAHELARMAADLNSLVDEFQHS